MPQAVIKKTEKKSLQEIKEFSKKRRGEIKEFTGLLEKKGKLSNLEKKLLLILKNVENMYLKNSKNPDTERFAKLQVFESLFSSFYPLFDSASSSFKAWDSVSKSKSEKYESSYSECNLLYSFLNEMFIDSLGRMDDIVSGKIPVKCFSLAGESFSLIQSSNLLAKFNALVSVIVNLEILNSNLGIIEKIPDSKKHQNLIKKGIQDGELLFKKLSKLDSSSPVFESEMQNLLSSKKTGKFQSTLVDSSNYIKTSFEKEAGFLPFFEYFKDQLFDSVKNSSLFVYSFGEAIGGKVVSEQEFSSEAVSILKTLQKQKFGENAELSLVSKSDKAFKEISKRKDKAEKNLKTAKDAFITAEKLKKGDKKDAVKFLKSLSNEQKKNFKSPDYYENKTSELEKDIYSFIYNGLFKTEIKYPDIKKAKNLFKKSDSKKIGEHLSQLNFLDKTTFASLLELVSKGSMVDAEVLFNKLVLSECFLSLQNYVNEPLAELLETYKKAEFAENQINLLKDMSVLIASEHQYLTDQKFPAVFKILKKIPQAVLRKKDGSLCIQGSPGCKGDLIAGAGTYTYEYSPKVQEEIYALYKGTLRKPPAFLTSEPLKWSYEDFFMLHPSQPYRKKYYESLSTPLLKNIPAGESVSVYLESLRNTYNPEKDLEIVNGTVNYADTKVGKDIATGVSSLQLMVSSSIDQAHSLDVKTGKFNYRNEEYLDKVIFPLRENYAKLLLGDGGLNKLNAFAQKNKKNEQTREAVLDAIYYIYAIESDIKSLKGFMDSVQFSAEKSGINLPYKIEITDKNITIDLKQEIELLESKAEELKNSINTAILSEDFEDLVLFVESNVFQTNEEAPLKPALLVDSHKYLKSLIFDYTEEAIAGTAIEKAVKDQLDSITAFEKARLWVSDNALAIVGTTTAVGGLVGAFIPPYGTYAVPGAKVGFETGSIIVGLVGLSFVAEAMIDVGNVYGMTPSEFQSYVSKLNTSFDADEKLMRGLFDTMFLRFGAGAFAGKGAFAQATKVMNIAASYTLIAGSAIRLGYIIPEVIEGKRSPLDIVETIPYLVIGAGGALKFANPSWAKTSKFIKMTEAPAWLFKPSGYGINLAFSVFFDEDVRNSWAKVLSGDIMEIDTALSKTSKVWKETTKDFVYFETYLVGPYNILKPAVVKLSLKKLPEWMLGKNLRAVKYLQVSGFESKVADALGRKLTKKEAQAIWELIYKGELITKDAIKKEFKNVFGKLSDETADAVCKVYSKELFEAKLLTEKNILSKSFSGKLKEKLFLLKKPGALKPVISEEISNEFLMKQAWKTLKKLKAGGKAKKLLKTVFEEKNVGKMYSLLEDFTFLSQREKTQIVWKLLTSGESVNSAFVQKLIGQKISSKKSSEIVNEVKNIWKSAKKTTQFKGKIPDLSKIKLSSKVSSAIHLSSFVGYELALFELEDLYQQKQYQKYLETLKDLMSSIGFGEYDALWYLMEDKIGKMKLKGKTSQQVLVDFAHKLVKQSLEKGVSPSTSFSLLSAEILDGNLKVNISEIINKASKVDKFLEDYSQDFGRGKNSFSMSETSLISDLLSKYSYSELSNKLLALYTEIEQNEEYQNKKSGYLIKFNEVYGFNVEGLSEQHLNKFLMLSSLSALNYEKKGDDLLLMGLNLFTSFTFVHSNIEFFDAMILSRNFLKNASILSRNMSLYPSLVYSSELENLSSEPRNFKNILEKKIKPLEEML
ncbi:hypothetical protein JXB01_04245 [Candidatus Micrarchaeota archaeon]|nr:hypothetical protein [Candidatus Micrarchaeota archaeon]